MKMLTGQRLEIPTNMQLVVLQFLSFRSEEGHCQGSNGTVAWLRTATYIQVILLTDFFSNLSITPLRVRLFLTTLRCQSPDLVSEAWCVVVSELPDGSPGATVIDGMEPEEPKLVLGRRSVRQGFSS